MAEARIGTCSWKYPSWQGLVYDEVGRGVNYLAAYSGKYDTVEVDQWFWSLFPGKPPALPRPAAVEEYAASVPENFRFSVKAPNSITLTHPYMKTKDAALVPNPHFLSVPLCVAFLKTLAPLGKRLGPVMLQFEYLNKQKMASQALFLKALDLFLSSLPGGFTFAVEPRNPNYLNRAYFDFLNEQRAAHVFLQGSYMPSIVGLYERFADSIRGTAVIRLHGPDREGMEKASGGDWSRILAPKDEELIQVAKMIRDLVRRSVNVYVNVNNHFEGSAPLTIERLVKLLG
ncbi:MAG: DUF72 domain-containing protein [Spirochaetales bacterium]|nr:DUF72 domain-containing protein [Spirochaetales bacterium]